MNTVAILSWSLEVDCPHCDEDMDLARMDSDYDHRFSNHIFNNRWDKLHGSEVECPHCEKEFKIDLVEY